MCNDETPQDIKQAQGSGLKLLTVSYSHLPASSSLKAWDDRVRWGYSVTRSFRRLREERCWGGCISESCFFRSQYSPWSSSEAIELAMIAPGGRRFLPFGREPSLELLFSFRRLRPDVELALLGWFTSVTCPFLFVFAGVVSEAVVFANSY